MKKNNTSLYLTAIFAVALLIGIGYAALTSTLNINGQTKITKASWDVHFENISTNDSEAIKFYEPNDLYGSHTAITNIDSLNATTLNYKVNLTGPDPSAVTTHDMNVDVVNKGTIDATISSVTLPMVSSMTSYSPANAQYALANIITINCAYSDGSIPKTGDVIPAGSSKTIICKHHYKANSELSEGDLSGLTSLSGTDIYARFALTINFYAK